MITCLYLLTNARASYCWKLLPRCYPPMMALPNNPWFPKRWKDQPSWLLTFGSLRLTLILIWLPTIPLMPTASCSFWWLLGWHLNMTLTSFVSLFCPLQGGSKPHIYADLLVYPQKFQVSPSEANQSLVSYTGWRMMYYWNCIFFHQSLMSNELPPSLANIMDACQNCIFFHQVGISFGHPSLKIKQNYRFIYMVDISQSYILPWKFLYISAYLLLSIPL
mgnify:CR=1 FL=1